MEGIYKFWNSFSAGPTIIHNIFHSVLCFCYRNIVWGFFVISFHLFVETLVDSNKIFCRLCHCFILSVYYMIRSKRAILMSINLIEKLFILFAFRDENFKHRDMRGSKKGHEMSRWFHSLPTQRMLLKAFITLPF